MSEIKLESAERLLEELNHCLDDKILKWGAGKMKACQDFQDRTLETVVKKLEDTGFYVSRSDKAPGAIQDVLSLKNAQPEPEVKSVQPIVGRLRTLKGRLINIHFDYTGAALVRDMIDHIEKQIDTPEPEPPVDPDWRELLVEAVQMIDELRHHVGNYFIRPSGTTAAFLVRCRNAIVATESP